MAKHIAHNDGDTGSNPVVATWYTWRCGTNGFRHKIANLVYAGSNPVTASMEDNMKLVKLTDGQEVEGDLVSEDDDTVTVGISIGDLRINRGNIASMNDILDCSQAPVGSFLESPEGVYIKMGDNHFRLVKGPYTSPVDLQRIKDGRYVTHEEVFSPEEEEVIAEPEGE